MNVSPLLSPVESGQNSAAATPANLSGLRLQVENHHLELGRTNAGVTSIEQRIPRNQVCSTESSASLDAWVDSEKAGVQVSRPPTTNISDEPEDSLRLQAQSNLAKKARSSNTYQEGQIQERREFLERLTSGSWVFPHDPCVSNERAAWLLLLEKCIVEFHKTNVINGERHIFVPPHPSLVGERGASSEEGEGYAGSVLEPNAFMIGPRELSNNDNNAAGNRSNDDSLSSFRVLSECFTINDIPDCIFTESEAFSLGTGGLPPHHDNEELSGWREELLANFGEGPSSAVLHVPPSMHEVLWGAANGGRPSSAGRSFARWPVIYAGRRHG
ncbi:MAG: hypothetical protein HC848_04560 [Limnobacter sp.]|nr:hypothetical protein [Limnobacter sp.]